MPDLARIYSVSRRSARAAVMAAVSEAVPQLRDQLLVEAGAIRPTPPALEELVRHTLAGVQTAGWRGRCLTATDVRVFHLLGRDCHAVGIAEQETIETMDDTAQEWLDKLLVPRARALDETYGYVAIDRAIVTVCAIVDDFTGQAYRALQQGWRWIPMERAEQAERQGLPKVDRWWQQAFGGY